MQCRVRQAPDEEAKLVVRMVELASEYGRYGYRRVTAMLRGEGWKVNHKRVERLWRQEGLKVPSRQPERKRLWLTDGSRVIFRQSTSKCTADPSFRESFSSANRQPFQQGES